MKIQTSPKEFRSWDGLRLEMDYLIEGCSDEVFLDFWRWPKSNKNKVYMQYTGLKDENGTKIFEGDILEVEVDHGEGCISRFNEVVDYSNEMVCFSPSNFNFGTKFKVIGNLFQTPELLEER